MVQTVKRSLLAILGHNKFSFEEMTTILREVKAIVNSLPLTPIHDAPHEQLALTPAYFVSGKRLTALPSVNVEDTSGFTKRDVTIPWLHRKKLLDYLEEVAEGIAPPSPLRAPIDRDPHR